MNSEIRVPIGFSKLNSLPEDPANSASYGKGTNSANCFMMIYPIDKKIAMPYGNEKEVIDGIHGALGPKQGLIEVTTGTTKSQKDYTYTIIKTRMEPSGIQYSLTMHIDDEKNCIHIKSYFDEAGMTGLRDATVMNNLINDGSILPTSMDSWSKDPYDENYKKGLLMNLSEKAEYDYLFPQHPLSESRALAKYIVDNN